MPLLQTALAAELPQLEAHRRGIAPTSSATPAPDATAVLALKRPGAPLGFPAGPEDLFIDAEGTPVRIDKAFSWEHPLAVLAYPQFAGVLAERWYFFAEARHPQNLYYRAMA